MAKSVAPKVIKSKMGMKREFINPFLLLGIVGGCMLLMVGTFATILYFLNRSAKVEDMIALLPMTVNNIRGVNMEKMKNYPGFSSEVDKFYNGEVKAGYEELMKNSGHNVEDLAYFIVAREFLSREGTNGKEVFIFTTQEVYDGPGIVAKVENTETKTLSGRNYYQLPTRRDNATLSGALLFFPNEKTMVMVRSGPVAETQMTEIIGAMDKSKEDTLVGKIGTAGKLAIRGHIWLIVRPIGGLDNYIKDTTGTLAADMKSFSEKGSNAGVMSVWTTMGGNGARLGAALELKSAEECDKMVEVMQDGPLGKGDESEIPNSMKKALSVSGQKEFKEFLQNLSFRSKDECAYIISKMETFDSSKVMLNIFNGASMATPASNFGGAGAGPGIPGGR